MGNQVNTDYDEMLRVVEEYNKDVKLQADESKQSSDELSSQVQNQNLNERMINRLLWHFYHPFQIQCHISSR